MKEQDITCQQLAEEMLRLHRRSRDETIDEFRRLADDMTDPESMANKVRKHQENGCSLCNAWMEIHWRASAEGAEMERTLQQLKSRAAEKKE